MKLSFWKTLSTNFMKMNREKVQIFLTLGKCLLCSLCSPPGCILVKISSPKIWSVKLKIYKISMCYIKGLVHLLWRLTVVAKTWMGSHLIATPYLAGHTHTTPTGLTLYYQLVYDSPSFVYTIHIFLLLILIYFKWHVSISIIIIIIIIIIMWFLQTSKYFMWYWLLLYWKIWKRQWVKMSEVDGSEMNEMTGTGFLNLEDGSDRLSQNVGKKWLLLSV